MLPGAFLAIACGQIGAMLLGLFLAIGARGLFSLWFGQGAINIPANLSKRRVTLRYTMTQGRVLGGANWGIASVQFAIDD